MAFHFFLAFVQNELFRLFQGNFHRVESFRERYIYLIMQDIRTETTYTDTDCLSFIFAQRARQLEQLQCFFQCNGFHGLPLFHLCKAWLFFIFCRANLYNRTETANLNGNGFTCSRFFPQDAFAYFMFRLDS